MNKDLCTVVGSHRMWIRGIHIGGGCSRRGSLFYKPCAISAGVMGGDETNTVREVMVDPNGSLLSQYFTELTTKTIDDLKSSQLRGMREYFTAQIAEGTQSKPKVDDSKWKLLTNTMTTARQNIQEWWDPVKKLCKIIDIHESPTARRGFAIAMHTEIVQLLNDTGSTPTDQSFRSFVTQHILHPNAMASPQIRLHPRLLNLVIMLHT